MTRIVCVSDTHRQLEQIEIPDGDILIHAGDLTMQGRRVEIATELQKLAQLPHAVKIFIAGNHDRLFEKDPMLARSLVRDVTSAGVVYLEESYTVVQGLKIWGSPWQPAFGNWAFNYDRAEGVERWSTMPDDADVVVTHGPPQGYGDVVAGRWSDHLGCVDLTTAIARTKPRLHVFGHIHSGRGVHNGLGACVATTFVNAACLGEDYRPCGGGIVVEM